MTKPEPKAGPSHDRTSIRPSTKATRRRSLQPRYLPYILIAPALVIVGIVAVYPTFYAAWLSMQNMNLLRVEESQWVGFDNYIALWNDPIFRDAVLKTIRWTVSIIALQLLVALPVALFLNLKFKGRGLLRSIVLVPYVMPAAVVAVIWVYMFDANFGVVNQMLTRLGIIGENLAWLSDSDLSFAVLILAMVWQGMPLMAITLLAALQGQRADIIEAASIDGANAWQRFWSITLPQLMPTIWLLLMLRTMWMSHHVDTIFLLTNGGPGVANFTLPIYSFNLSTQQYDVAYASAIAIILSVILLGIATVYVRQLDRAKSYL